MHIKKPWMKFVLSFAETVETDGGAGTAPEATPEAETATGKQADVAQNDEAEGTQEDAKPEGFKSEESKEAVLADLAGERDARQAAEKRATELSDELTAAKQQVTATEERAAKAESLANRLQVALDTGVRPDLLNGSTPEELKAHAEQLIAWRGNNGAAESGTSFDAGIGVAGGTGTPRLHGADLIANTYDSKSK